MSESHSNPQQPFLTERTQSSVHSLRVSPPTPPVQYLLAPRQHPFAPFVTPIVHTGATPQQPAWLSRSRSRLRERGLGGEGVLGGEGRLLRSEGEGASCYTHSTPARRPITVTSTAASPSTDRVPGPAISID